MSHTYYSQRTGTNPNLNGLPLKDTIDLFLRVFAQMEEDGYFHEAFGFWCVDAGHIKGRIPDVELEMLLTIRKKELWPIANMASRYTEDDFFDVLEFLYQHVPSQLTVRFTVGITAGCIGKRLTNLKGELNSSQK